MDAEAEALVAAARVPGVWGSAIRLASLVPLGAPQDSAHALGLCAGDAVCIERVEGMPGVTDARPASRRLIINSLSLSLYVCVCAHVIVVCQSSTPSGSGASSDRAQDLPFFPLLFARWWVPSACFLGSLHFCIFHFLKWTS